MGYQMDFLRKRGLRGSRHLTTSIMIWPLHFWPRKEILDAKLKGVPLWRKHSWDTLTWRNPFLSTYISRMVWANFVRYQDKYVNVNHWEPSPEKIPSIKHRLIKMAHFGPSSGEPKKHLWSTLIRPRLVLSERIRPSTSTTKSLQNDLKQ